MPLFVAFLAAIVGAFAAFFVWLELLMRDAAVYVVALFMPLALAASIWPRWSGTLRRTAELLVVVIGSKFVIVSIVALAAALVAGGGGGVEHVLAASALMLLACFAPFVLLRLVPFAEGAMGAAYGRRSAAGGRRSAPYRWAATRRSCATWPTRSTARAGPCGAPRSGGGAAQAARTWRRRRGWRRKQRGGGAGGGEAARVAARRRRPRRSGGGDPGGGGARSAQRGGAPPADRHRPAGGRDLTTSGRR